VAGGDQETVASASAAVAVGPAGAPGALMTPSRLFPLPLPNAVGVSMPVSQVPQVKLLLPVDRPTWKLLLDAS